MVPAWTFVATAHAVRNAGAVPWFVDVDPDRWALTPDLARAALRTAPGPVAAVMPVVPFGAPFDLAPWEDFQDETGVPVVVDAAAAFDTLVPRSVPAVVSLHATKVLGTGEGGLVACTDPRLVQRIRQAANFGFYGSRIAELPGTNAKLSEYHAAVGLAALDAWPETRAAWMAVAGHCRRHLAPLAGVTIQPGFGESWIGSTCMVSFASTGQKDVASRLQAAGIETRAWWGDGPSGHPAFRDAPCPVIPHPAFPHPAFPHTAGLAARVLGLPFAVDLGDDDMARVAASLERTLNRPGAPCPM
jgi:dTDP-4-amino-4,6-dideoxygalactose transaminase